MRLETIRSKLIGLIVILTIGCVLLAGCLGNNAATGSGELLDKVEFPLAEPVTLSYWASISGNALPVFNNYADTAWYQETEAHTGVQINFIHPVAGQVKEQFNLMLASRDLPDMIERHFDEYSGGIVKAYTDGLVIDIKALQEKYAPNLTKLYKAYPELVMDVSTENGEVLRVPFIRGHDTLRSFRGLAVRRDWLKELNLEEPQTIGDWYSVLTAFKTRKNISTPLLIYTETLKRPGLISAFGITYDYFSENGKLVFGPGDPRYKDFLSTMKKWYDEDLIYSEFALGSNSKAFDALITNGEVGSMHTLAGGGIGKYMELMAEIDPAFDLVGIPYPSLVKGEPPIFMHQDPIVYHSGSVSISSMCARQDIAMAWLDFGYSPEGNKIMNFGVEGESYNMVDGYPEFTDLILNNPDFPPSTIGHKYSRMFSQGPCVQDDRYLEQYLSLPQQHESIGAWIKFSDAANKANTRVYGQLTPEESIQVVTRQVEINTYVDEMLLKFIMGVESLDEYDQYVARLKQMGLDDVLAIKQTAHDRFLERFPHAKEVRSVNVIDYYKSLE